MKSLQACFIFLLILFFSFNLLALERKTLTIGAFTTPNTPWDLNWDEVIKLFSERKDLGLDLELLIRGETGSSEERLNALRRNRLQWINSPLGSGAALVPELAVLQLPFLFDSTEQADFVLDKFAFSIFQRKFLEKGIIFLSWTEGGANHLFGDRPFFFPSDVKQYPMRVQTTKASSVFFENLGADSVYLPSNDILPSLQTGMILGGEAVMIFYWMTGIYKEATHLTLTGHSIEPSSILINKIFWDGLDAEQKELVEDSHPSQYIVRRRVREWMIKVQNDLEDLNIKIHSLNEQQTATWRSRARLTYSTVLENIGNEAEEIYIMLMEGKSAYQREKFGGVVSE